MSRGLTTAVDGTGSTNGGTGALTYAWSEVSGPKVTFSDATAAKPAVSVPFFTKASDTAPVAADNPNPAVLQLKVTDSTGASSTG